MATYEVFTSSATGLSKVKKDQTSLKYLLQKKNIQFIEYDVASDSGAHARMIATSGKKDLPQFWVNGAFLGTYDDILELEEVGELNARL